MATPQARLREFLPNARELALLFGARGIACIVAWLAGFRALSDDDYARISIAQHFAHAVRFDPSRTSWLPAPFWAYGTAFHCFGTSLTVARATAIALSLCATVLVYVAARMLGSSRLAALLSGVLSCVALRYSILLGLAAVPEVPCAALLLFSSATLVRREAALRMLGGVSLILACLARYEAWPIALVFSLFCLWDAIRERRPSLAFSALLALFGPALWLMVGRIEHGDAVFFIARVTAYRRALGGNQASTLSRLLVYPRLMVGEAFALCALVLAAALAHRKDTARSKLPYGRCALAMLSMLAFLMLGSVRDGVPTHHASRVLLPIWYFGCIVAGAQLAVTRKGAHALLTIIASTPIALLLARPNYDFASRSLELEAGNTARVFGAHGLAIDTPDYGFFAVQAGFGSPIETSVLDDHDPRHPSTSPFSSAAVLDQALRQQSAHFAIVTLGHTGLLAPRCGELWRNSAFALFRCADAP